MIQLDDIQRQYDRALRYFLLTKHEQAATTCVKALDKLSALTDHQTNDALVDLRLQLSLLFINNASAALTTTSMPTLQQMKQWGLSCTLSDSIDQFCLALWTRLYDADKGDPRLVGAFLLMTLKLSIPLVGRNVAEHWLATSNSDRRADTDNWTYSLQVIEIYATRILPACGDLGSARSFVEYNSLLSNENKEAFFQLIQLAENYHIRRRERLEQQQAAKGKERRKKDAIMKQQRKRQRQERLTKSSPSVAQPESPKKVSDQGLTVIKAWLHHLKVTGSVAIMVVMFALLGLLKGPRGYLTDALKMIMTRLWQTARTGTKVNDM